MEEGKGVVAAEKIERKLSISRCRGVVVVEDDTGHLDDLN